MTLQSTIVGVSPKFLIYVGAPLPSTTPENDVKPPVIAYVPESAPAVPAIDAMPRITRGTSQARARVFISLSPDRLSNVLRTFMLAPAEFFASIRASVARALDARPAGQCK